ncbi:hypothetical protein [uncultured Tolumonas sp.]|uniref:hypothetical protein n=1 Tax=uncultured Tolumonas sp. TaxID=263765 RepID=UPI002A0A9D3B|nr:hypothetical protein [uncultured Tolumonas sp.]
MRSEQNELPKPTTQQSLDWLRDINTPNGRCIIELIELYKKEIKSAYELLNDKIVSMQACIIETEHNGHEEGFKWIYNSLCGPGLIPEPDEDWYESAQLYWNANNSHPYGPCHICGKPANSITNKTPACFPEHVKVKRINES